MPGILAGDATSWLCVGEKMIVLATHSGKLHLLDLNGNQVCPLSPSSLCGGLPSGTAREVSWVTRCVLCVLPLLLSSCPGLVWPLGSRVPAV